jgi:hypothetical protein
VADPVEIKKFCVCLEALRSAKCDIISNVTQREGGISHKQTKSLPGNTSLWI